MEPDDFYDLYYDSPGGYVTPWQIIGGAPWREPEPDFGSVPDEGWGWDSPDIY